MDYWTSFKEAIASVKGYIPGALIMLIGLPIIFFGTRKPKHKPENEEKNKVI